MEQFRPQIEAWHAEGLYQADIATRLGTSRVSVTRYMQSIGLGGHNRNFLTSLTADQASVLTGTLLGDAHIQHKGGRGYHLTMVHCRRQRDYLLWKKDKLGSLFGPNAVRDYAQSGSERTRAWSRSHPILETYHRQFYCRPEGHLPRKMITSEILGRVDNLALAVWFMDDGSGASGHGLRLLLGAVTQKEVDLVVAWLAGKGIPVNSVSRPKTKVWTLNFRGVGNMMFRESVGAHIHPSLRYKLDPIG